MKLFLASEAKNPASLDFLKEFVSGFTDKRIAYIPTAANGEFYGAWKDGGSIKTVHTLGAHVDVVELEITAPQEVATRLESADIIWFAGGMSGYLLYWIRRTKLDEILPQMLAGDKVYVGSSSGSMITSKSQDVAEWYIGEPEPGASLIPGLNLVDFEIYPHYNEELLPEIKKRWKGNKLYLLKDGEAITVVDGKISVLGEERILLAGS